MCFYSKRVKIGIMTFHLNCWTFAINDIIFTRARAPSAGEALFQTFPNNQYKLRKLHSVWLNFPKVQDVQITRTDIKKINRCILAYIS